MTTLDTRPTSFVETPQPASPPPMPTPDPKVIDGVCVAVKPQVKPAMGAGEKAVLRIVGTLLMTGAAALPVIEIVRAGA